MNHTMRNVQRILSNCCFIVICSIASYIVMCFIMPDLFVWHTVSFMRLGDAAHNYLSTFMLVQNAFRGGVGLWDYFDQMPFAYTYVAGGIQFANIVTAISYILLSRFFFTQSHAYHTLYSSLYYLPSICVNTAGMYLLLHRFVRDRLVMFISLVVSSSLYMPQIFLGLSSGSLYVFFPLVMHFFLSLLESGSMYYFLLFVVALALGFGMNFEVASGYWYGGIHYFLTSALVWYVVTRRLKILHRFGRIRFALRRRQLIFVGAAFICCFFLLLPLLGWGIVLKNDFNISDTTGRFANSIFLNFAGYFNRVGQSFAPPGEFLMRLVNFSDNHWESSYMYIGFTAVFLSICALVFSKDSKRWIFAATLFCIWWVNSPREMTGWQAPIHWFTAVTNPLNFIIRSFHMIGAFMTPFLFATIVGVGLQSLNDFNAEGMKKMSILKLSLAMALLLAFYSYVSGQVSSEVVIYLYLGIGASLILLVLRLVPLPHHVKKIVLLVGIIGLFVRDGYYQVGYLRIWTDRMQVITHPISTSEKEIVLDYQNPYILPLRTYTDPVNYFLISGPLNVDAVNNDGFFYRYANMAKFYDIPDVYKPRHKSYTELYTDSNVRKYLQANPYLISVADYAYVGPRQALSDIVQGNSSRSVVLLDEASDAKFLTQTLPAQASLQDQSIEYNIYDFSLSGAAKSAENDMDLYFIKLPNDFPAYLATGVFTKDIGLISAKVGDKSLHPLQGDLQIPYAFDVQNIKTGYVTISMPKGSVVEHQDLILRIPKQYAPNIQKIVSNTSDTFTIEYVSQKPQWLVYHFPYDTKWQAIVDGKVEKFYRVNASFIGLPLDGGTHVVSLQYWPDSWMRPAIFVQFVFIIMTPFGLIVLGLYLGDKKDTSI